MGIDCFGGVFERAGGWIDRFDGVFERAGGWIDRFDGVFERAVVSGFNSNKKTLQIS
ncbi:hypothetical protein [Filibacter tadaridae]|uniref:hypothetical protein n=1 Tax=Filibacter tadaridae TaxID=2483811 RepID=UPI0013571E3E|nr:hypothetical protein [Filibacter tadaridae]